MELDERRITRIEVDAGDATFHGDVTFYFSDTGDEPFSSKEFILESKKLLITIEEAIDRFNELNEGREP